MTTEINKPISIDMAEAPVQLAQRLDNVVLNPRVDQSLMKSPIWELGQAYGLKRYFGTYPIGISSTFLFTWYNSPERIMTRFGPSLAKAFRFFKANVVFHIEIQSTFQHQGAIIAYYNPMSYFYDRDTAFTGLSSDCANWVPNGPRTDRLHRTLLPHSFITLGHNGNYTFKLPWNCNRTMLPTKVLKGEDFYGDLYYYSMGFFSVEMFSPLKFSANVTPTSSMRVWISLENLEYAGWTGQNYGE